MSEPNNKGRWELYLSDEIFINILSYLQAKDVLRYRCVSKGWRDLTSTPYFVDLHKKHCIGKMIVVDVPQRKWGHRNQFFLDEWWLTTRKKPTVLKFYSQPLYFSEFSQDGLHVMESTCSCSHKILIFNPIFREKVKIVISSEWHSRISNIYGVYFNPTLQEYCALVDISLSLSLLEKLVPSHSSIIKPPITYKMLTLGPKPCLRDIRNPFKDRYPTQFRLPVLLDGFLYWMIDLENGQSEHSYHLDIMEFDIKSNEFKVMRYPSEMEDYGVFGLYLFSIDGFLTLFQIAVHDRAVVVNMWTLNDRASESWTCSNYYVDYKVYPGPGICMRLDAIAYKDGVLVINSEQRLYVCNLKLGTSKILGNKMYNNSSMFFPHEVCLSSLKNCKPVIQIGNRKKCRECERLDNDDASSSNSSVNEHSDVVEDITVSVLNEGA